MSYIEWYVFGAAALLGLGFLFCRGIFEEQKKKKQFIRSLREDYGKRPVRDYDELELKNLMRGEPYRTTAREGSIDAVTWNDLDLDHIYMQINHTWSQSGGEFLYSSLKNPLMDEEELAEHERVISYFMEHSEERVRMQTAFASIGRTQKMTLTEYLYNLRLLEQKSSLVHYVCCAFAAFSILMIFVRPPVGFGLFIAALVMNLLIYFRRKGEIEPYITTFGYLLRMMHETKNLMGLRTDELSVYFDEMKAALFATKSFRRHSYILMSGKRFTGTVMELPLDYLRMFFHLDLIKFNSMLKHICLHMDDVLLLIHHVGFLDAMISVGEYRASLPVYAIPSFLHSEEAVFEVQGLYHPLVSGAVQSSVTAHRGVLITGSNASGKSTFLKAAAAAAILAQSIHTVPAQSYTASFFSVYSSMALSDNILGGESYYMVEIRSLKRVLDAAEREHHVLCFVDEVLRGTNTVERIAASSHILKSLCRPNTICFAATHDIELTQILENFYDNYHFTEEVQENDIVFPYRLLKGRADTRNAIRLLQLIGYRDEITREAELDGGYFAENGVWRVFEAENGGTCSTADGTEMRKICM